MFSLKIAYKGKNILLGKGTDSFKKIEQELNSRFPGEFPYGIVLKYQGNTINEFQQIEALAVVSVNKSLKLEVQAAEPKKLDVIQEEKKSEISSAPSAPQPNFDPVIKAQQNQVKVENAKEEEKNTAANQPVQQTFYEVNVSIDSVSSDQQLQIKPNHQQGQRKVDHTELIPKKEEEIAINEQINTNIVPTQVKEQENDKINTDMVVDEQKPETVKCTIFDGVPKQNAENEAVKEEQKVQIKQNKNKNYQSQVQACQEYVSVIKIEKDIRQIQAGVYQCIFCRELQFCNVCETKRKLGPGSKFFKLVDVIVDKKLNDKIAELQFALFKFKQVKVEEPKKLSEVKKEQPKKEQPKKEQPKKVEVNHEKQKQKQRIKAANIEVNDLSGNKRQVLLGGEITWGFTLRMKQMISFNHNISIIDERTNDVKQITFENDSVILVGPFDALSQGKFDKTYRLCFVLQDGSLQLFGPKFGFSVNVVKEQKKKTLTNTFRQNIQQIKKGYKIQRSTEYLIEKLKELGINEDNYEQNKQIIPDVIQTV